MIRFRCPTCDREYVLPDALARLPLLCKGCGARLDVPDPQPDDPAPPPVPVPPPAPPPVVPASAVVPPVPVKAAPPPVRPPVATDPDRRRTWVAGAADAAVVVALVAVGAVLGEVVARKPTGEVLAGAADAPADLVLWLGCALVPALVYVLLAARGRSVGGWLRRRGG